MKFSEFWLREWVNLEINSELLVNQITMFGLEVDYVEPVAGEFSGIVVGRIVECRQHPNVNKLCIVKVDIGSDRLLDIICDALNCHVDLLVAVAITDAILPNGFKVKVTKLHGELSEGMLCSFSELGIINNHDGIIELPDEAPIGKNIRDYLHLDDKIININVTPNRSDCLGLLGIARDVAAKNRLPLNMPVIETVIPKINDVIPIRVDEYEACIRYFSRIINNINVNAVTPLWMKEKLRRCGIRSVDVIVDISNYILLELGQPICVFDRENIKGGIIIRYAKHSETLTLLDGSIVMLSPDTLVISDYSKILAIAGILNDSLSKISSTTRDIVLECACFNPLAITGQARRYGLHNDASHRYEHGVDPELQSRAIERVTTLLLDICGGQPGPVIDATSKLTQIKPIIITLRRKMLDRLIGYFIPDKDISDILIRLGFQISQTTEGWQVIAPSWRFDIAIEADLIEEVARMYGYEAIPNMPVCANLVIPYCREVTTPLSRVKTLLVDRGYQEAITYSFVDPKIQALLHPQQASLILPRPISQNMSNMRLSLWTGLISTAVYNQNRQQQRVRLFESGLCFIPDNKADLGVRQDLMLSGLISGPLFDENWDQPRQLVDFYDAKGDLEAILELTGKLNNIEFRVQSHPALHPGKSAAIYLNNEFIGFIGVIHPYIKSKLNLNSCMLVFELLWEKIAERKIPKVNHVSRFPANRRDIAVVVSDNVAAADVIIECKKAIKNHLVIVNLFDVYRGRGIEKGFKSLAISLILQDITHTLKEEEISMIVAKCIAALKQKFKASLRD
ncbi:Phenylalanine--tRNA ligase beta subunit [Candidatus Gullanella endobia]|uniref:Phenylalanine--tRNA ligase beta subunit n=1 Tax=Candidatus Gullanella endobia TaxID=1070130 RepID=A0A143WQ31_9ENTR|nr:phenylalanine--tRNA ligase subunit beta [Candidatus Gullanella endobia]CUX95896.1 Phenylalanine--tRNA ligase beta subunit [Candidatus Gullanella endobia]